MFVGFFNEPCRTIVLQLVTASANIQLLPFQDDVCVCHKIADWVCGNDGRSYENPCRAKCAGAQVRCAGRCPCQ